MSGNGNGNGNGHSVALWAGLAAFFTNIAAINILALVGDESNPRVTAIAAFVTAICVAASVYAKARWEEAKEERARKRDEH